MQSSDGGPVSLVADVPTAESLPQCRCSIVGCPSFSPDAASAGFELCTEHYSMWAVSGERRRAEVAVADFINRMSAEIRNG